MLFTFFRMKYDRRDTRCKHHVVDLNVRYKWNNSSNDQTIIVTMPGKTVSCRSCLRKCWHWLLCHKPVSGLVFIIQDEFRIICLGLSGSGKTTMLNALTGNTGSGKGGGLGGGEPTSGFNIKTLPLTSLKCDSNLKGKSISFKELGGSKHVQQFWCNHYPNKNGILFLVNAVADENEFEASKQVLSQVLQDGELTGKPCLILSTHNDIEGAREERLIEREFGAVIGKRKWAIRACCSFNGEQVKSAIEVLIDLILDDDVRE